MIYNILVITTIVISLLIISWISERKYTFKSLYINFLLFIKDDFILLFNSETRGVLSYLKLMRLMSFYSSAILFIIMALSGFLPFVSMGTSLSGLALIIHVTAAPLFCLTYAFYIILSAFQYKFEYDNYLFVFHRNSIEGSSEFEAAKDNVILKSAFWISAVVSVPVIISIILSMFPIFSTSGMHYLTDLHRYSVLIFTISFVINIFYSIILRIQDKNNT